MTDPETGLDLPVEPILRFREAIEKKSQLALEVLVNTPWRSGLGSPQWIDIWLENVRVFHRSQTTGAITVVNGPAVARSDSDTTAQIILPLVDSPQRLLTLTITFVDVKRQAQAKDGEFVPPIIKQKVVSYNEGIYAAKTQDLEEFLRQFGTAALSGLNASAHEAALSATPVPSSEIEATRPATPVSSISEPTRGIPRLVDPGDATRIEGEYTRTQVADATSRWVRLIRSFYKEWIEPWWKGV